MASINNIKGIPPEKLTVLQRLSSEINNLPPELVISCIAKANSELAAKNMSFTQNELNMILEQLTEDLPAQTKARIEILRGMLIHSN